MRKVLFIAGLLLFAGVAFGQTLKKGCVIGVHHVNIVLQEGKTMNDLIEFNVQKYIPAFEKALPGLKLFIMEGERGEETGNIGFIYYFDSVKVRDEYWPQKDVNSEKVNTALQKHLGPLQEEMQKIIKSSTSGHTDWKIL